MGPRRPAEVVGLFAVETTPGYEWSVPGDAPVVDGAGNVVGVTTTSAYGTEARATLASGFLFDEAARGAPLFVECYGEQFPAAVLAAPPAPVRGRDAPPVAFAAPSLEAPKYALGGVRAQSSRAGNHLRPLGDDAAPALEIVAKSVKPWETDEYFALTRLPVEAAHTFGRDMYVSEAIFASESKLLFDREWVCSGVAPDVAKHGMVAPLWAPGAPVSVWIPTTGFGGSPPNFRTLYLGQIEVDSADFWTNRLLSSSSRSTVKNSGPNRSITRTLKSG